MQNQSVLVAEQVQEIRHIIEKYPYCQSAYLPLLKYYYAQNHVDFEELLKLTAVYSSDRNQVRKYLMTETKKVEVQKEKPEVEEKEIVEITTAEIHDPLLELLNA